MASPVVDYGRVSVSAHILQCPQILAPSPVPFHFKATRISSLDPVAPHTCTLLLTCPIGGSAELWAPFLRRVFEAQRDTPGQVGAAWVVESPNHGDAAVLNEALLKEHHQHHFPIAQYGAAIRALLDAPHVSPAERSSLVALTHSAGAVAIFFAGTVPELRTRFRAFVMVEGPDIPQESHAQLAHHVAAFTLYNAGRPAHWPSRTEGVHFLRTHRPWKAFHPEALAIACVSPPARPLAARSRPPARPQQTYFRADAAGAWVPKTPPAHESATWADFPATGELVRRLELMVASATPVCIVVGGVRTFWYVELEAALSAVHERLRRKGAEVRVVEGAGHYVPQEKPDELAQVVLDVLGRLSIAQRAKL
ncbi:hypothetical protein FA95DRAFT_1606941 [Auriscalpium vulgare]|uniref:Uncharacterized protein n=1 Tax=Auriscalpium vulgare TaxID=40419 RepID=A0ACB8RRV2_9AGAM|nr:hypothetical protein FA95DRAFT_1606941 [Auriscalpium vulgare]